MNIPQIIKKFGIERGIIAKGIGMKYTVFNVYLSQGFPKKHLVKIETFLKKYSQELFGELMNLK